MAPVPPREARDSVEIQARSGDHPPPQASMTRGRRWLPQRPLEKPYPERLVCGSQPQQIPRRPAEEMWEARIKEETEKSHTSAKPETPRGTGAATAGGGRSIEAPIEFGHGPSWSGGGGGGGVGEARDWAFPTRGMPRSTRQPPSRPRCGWRSGEGPSSLHRNSRGRGLSTCPDLPRTFHRPSPKPAFGDDEMMR